MSTTLKYAAVFSAAIAVASCSGNPSQYQGAAEDGYGYEAQGIDTNWVWAGLALGLLLAVSAN
jgi:hypothetical protein